MGMAHPFGVSTVLPSYTSSEPRNCGTRRTALYFAAPRALAERYSPYVKRFSMVSGDRRSLRVAENALELSSRSLWTKDAVRKWAVHKKLIVWNHLTLIEDDTQCARVFSSAFGSQKSAREKDKQHDEKTLTIAKTCNVDTIATIFGEFLIFIKEKSVVVRWKEITSRNFSGDLESVGESRASCSWNHSGDLESVGESRASDLFIFLARISQENGLHCIQVRILPSHTWFRTNP